YLLFIRLLNVGYRYFSKSHLQKGGCHYATWARNRLKTAGTPAPTGHDAGATCLSVPYQCFPSGTDRTWPRELHHQIPGSHVTSLVNIFDRPMELVAAKRSRGPSPAPFLSMLLL